MRVRIRRIRRARSVRRTTVWLVATVALALISAGCGATIRGEGDGPAGDNGTKQGPLRIAVVPKAVGFDFWEQVRKGAECAASQQQEVTVQWDGVTKETDVTGQVDLLQNMITQQVDGLVYAATDAKVLANVTKNARNQGITVVNIDSGTDPQPTDVPVFATDNEAAAATAADRLATSLGSGGHKIALIPFQPGTSTNDQRLRGFKKGLKKHPNLEVVAEQSSDSDYNRALTVTENILTAHPDLDGIFAANEPGALGAAEGVRRAGKKGKIKIIGWDAASDEIKAVRDGTISGLVVQNPFRMGYEAVNAAVTELREGTAQRSVDTGVTFVTNRNLKTHEVKAVLNPSCVNPPT